MKRPLFSRGAPRRGFTLVEVLAAMLLLGIVLPTLIRGITLGNSTAGTTRRRDEASGLAEAKLDEIIATNLWQNQTQLAGDFGAAWSDYKWQATITPWPQDTSGANIQEIDVVVTWKYGGQPNQVKLSTLAYVRPTSS